MLHDGRSTIANVEPSTLVPAVVIESMSSWVSRLCSQADGEDVLNAFAYSSAFHPMCMAIVETMQQIPIAVQVGWRVWRCDAAGNEASCMCRFRRVAERWKVQVH